MAEDRRAQSPPETTNQAQIRALRALAQVLEATGGTLPFELAEALTAELEYQVEAAQVRASWLPARVSAA
jgi:hypothetical protein